jgi:formylglycine-generating enzyme required for sulfatase activity/serine/threonine protein kinase
MNDENFDTLDNLPTMKSSDGSESKILAGRYRIIRKLGEGGMGLVYLAEDTELGNEKVAIKFIPPMLANNTRAINNLKKEAQTARQLSHPNIVRLHDLHTDGHQKFLVMEHIEGRTLEQVLDGRKDNKITFAQLLPIAEQIAAGLDYAHKKKVLHRDLKPSNIMIAKDGVVKLLDFGIAREMKDSYTRVTGKETSGTLPYMSPQQLMGEQPTVSMDIYSFAAVIYECLSGHPPFYMGDIREQIKSKIPTELVGLSPSINNAILSALAKAPSKRPNKASELIAMLTGKKKAPIYKDTLDHSKTINIKVEKAKVRKKRTKIFVAIIILVLLLAGVFVVRDYQNRERQRADVKKKQEDLFKAWNIQNDAEKVVEKNDYTQAIKLLDKLIAEYPGTQYAQWASTKKPIWQKALEDERQNRLLVTTLLSQAETLKKEGLLDKSLEAVGEVLTLEPANEQAKKFQIDLISAIEKNKSQEERERNFNTYFNAGYDSESKRDWEKAIEEYIKALAVKPDDDGAKDKLATCQHNLYLQKAEEAEGQDDLSEAINYYTKALSYKQVESTQTKLDSAQQKVLQNKTGEEKRVQEYYKWLKQAQDSEQQGDLVAAVKLYQKAQEFTDEPLSWKIDSLNARIATRMAEAEKQKVLEEEKQRKLKEEKQEKLLEAERQEKQARYAELLSYAKARDNKEQGKDALKALDEALVLYPGDREASALKKKIDGYYNISSGKIVTNSIGMKLVFIPAGGFVMGSPSSESQRDNDEGPQHKVTISKSFYMGIYEVTQEQYQAVMGNNRSYFKGENLPAERVSWNDAVEFCKKLSRKEGKTYRLPTEAEWEYACRAGTTTPFNTGETISTECANYYGNYTYGNGHKGLYRQKTTPVGSFSPNAFGLYDMHGNVWEWCQDRYDSKYYSNSPTVDPQGPSKGQYRVLRGGSWLNTWGCRSALRFKDKPNKRGGDFGFRVVSLDLK